MAGKLTLGLALLAAAGLPWLLASDVPEPSWDPTAPGLEAERVPTLLGSGAARAQTPARVECRPAPTPAPVAQAGSDAGTKRVVARVVTQAGTPLEGVAIHDGEAHDGAPLGWTDVDGRAVVDVAERVYRLGAAVKAPWLPHARAWIKPTERETVIVVRRGRTVRGVVRGLPKEALRTCTIVARWKAAHRDDQSLQRMLFAACDARGRFEIVIPEEVAAGRLYALPPSSVPSNLRSYGTAALPATAESEAILEFAAPRRIRGVVVTEDGRPVVAGSVDLEPVDHVALDSTLKPLGVAANRFTFEGLQPGQYEIRVYPTGDALGFSAPMQVEAGDTDVRIVVPDAGRVSGSVAGLVGERGVTAQWWRRESTDAPYRLQETVQVSTQGTFGFLRASGGDTELRIVRGHDVIARAVGLRVPDDNVWLTLQPTP